MSDETISMNPISCRRCKEKKTRCSKSLPQCGKCVEGGFDCEYNPRAARPKRQRSQAARLGDTVSDILQRLSSVEDRIASTDTGILLEGAPSFHVAQTAKTGPHLQMTRDHCGGLLESLGLTNPSFSDVVLHTITQAHDALLAHVSQHWLPQEYNLYEMLNSIPHVTRLSGMMQGIEPCEDINISPETATQWVKLYFINFRALDAQLPLDEQLMLRLPLLGGLAYVDVDASESIIYYHVLLRGMLLDAELRHRRRELSTAIYRTTIQCLERWQHEAGQRLIDFQAAFLMSWMAADFFDYDLSWNFFRQACTIGRHLGIFTVDSDNVPVNCGDISTDCTLTQTQKRFAFWQLLQTDCLFRQLFGKTAVIPFGTWQVRFPELSASGVESQSSIQVHFIISMRFAFVTLRFLELLDTQGYILEDQVTELILELKSVVTDWDLERSYTAAAEPTDAWLYADLLISSQLLIISFQQSIKTSDPSQQIPESCLDAARQSIRILEHSSKLSIGDPYNTISLVSSYPVIHVFILFLNILTDPGSVTAEGDLYLTNCFGLMLRKWSEKRDQVGAHLAFVVNVLNEICRRVVYAKALPPAQCYT